MLSFESYFPLKIHHFDKIRKFRIFQKISSFVDRTIWAILYQFLLTIYSIFVNMRTSVNPSTAFYNTPSVAKL